MSMWRVVLYFLASVRVGGVRFDLSILLEKIFRESDSAVVYFVGIDDNFVANFMATHPDVAVAIFTEIPSNYDQNLFQRKATLVTRAVDEGPQSKDDLHTFIGHMRSRDFVVIVASGLESLSSSLSFCKEIKFKWIFGAVGDTSYAYLPFADEPLQRLTRPEEGLPNALKDLNGYAFRTTVQTNYPRCFWYPDSQGQFQIGGYAGRTLLEFFRRHNGTFREVLINDSRNKSLLGIINATLKNEIDISMTPYAPFQGLDFSHPIKVMAYRIMVPMYGYLDPDQSFSKPFTLAVWGCVGLLLVYIVCMDFVKDICVSVTPNWWRSFRRTYLFMLLSSAGVSTSSGYRFHAQVLLFSFIVSNLYLAFCTSFLTAIIRVKGYDTIQELIDNKVPVIIPMVEWELIRRAGSHDLDPISVPVHFDVYWKAINSITNTSQAYSVDEDFAHFLIHMRHRRQVLLIHIVREKLFGLYQMFLLPKHSLFGSMLNVLVEDVAASGLIDKWERDVRAQAISAGFHIEELDELLPILPKALEVGYLKFAWICLLVGLVLATIAAVFEVFGLERWIWRVITDF